MIDYLPYDEACAVVRKCKIKSRLQFRNFNKGRSSATRIPSSPNEIYKEWVSWGDFLGTGSHSNTFNKKIVPYDEAKKIINDEIQQHFKINDRSSYIQFTQSDLYLKKYASILPVAPKQVYTYHKSWVSWDDFLMITYNNAISYSKLKIFFRTYHVTDFDTLNDFMVNTLPGLEGVCIPRDIETHYKSKNDWVSWDDLFGTKNDIVIHESEIENTKTIEERLTNIENILLEIRSILLSKK